MIVLKRSFSTFFWNLETPCTYVPILFVRAVEWLMNCPLFFFCRGIFKLLVKFQLDNKDNPSYTGTCTRTHTHTHTITSRSGKDNFLNICLFLLYDCYVFSSLCKGLSFQDFYQRCREAFLVNSDLTLRTQLTEFRDHKLIRTRKVQSCFTLKTLTAIILSTSVSLTYI